MMNIRISRKAIHRIIIIAMCLLIPFFLFYGPISSFRVLWIQTAMHTSHCKFLAQWLYTDRYIQKVLQENLVSTDYKSDPKLIKMGVQDDAIELAEIKGPYYQGYLIKVANPARVTLVPSQAEEGELLEDIVLRAGALGGINAGGYLSDRQQGLPDSFCVANGNIIRPAGNRQRHIVGGMDDNHRLLVGTYSSEELEDMRFRWAVDFGPILLVNGENSYIAAAAGGLAPRTAIGQTTEGAILLVVIDGRQPKSVGATYLDLQRIFEENNAMNAIVLDGGSSSSMVYEGQLINSPSSVKEARRLPNAIVFQ